MISVAWIKYSWTTRLTVVFIVKWKMWNEKVLLVYSFLFLFVIGIAFGDITFSFVGNDEIRHYVESGLAVDDVRLAQALCDPHQVVMSPRAWNQCDHRKFRFTRLPHRKYVRVRITWGETFLSQDVLKRRHKKHSFWKNRVNRSKWHTFSPWGVTSPIRMCPTWVWNRKRSLTRL